MTNDNTTETAPKISASESAVAKIEATLKLAWYKVETLFDELKKDVDPALHADLDAIKADLHDAVKTVPPATGGASTEANPPASGANAAASSSPAPSTEGSAESASSDGGSAAAAPTPSPAPKTAA